MVRQRVEAYVFLSTSHTCSKSQQTGPELHFAPQSLTSSSLSSTSGSSARPLSGHGSGFPKKPLDPQCPRIAQRPASWMGVKGLLSAAAVAVPRPTNSRPPRTRDSFAICRNAGRTEWAAQRRK